MSVYVIISGAPAAGKSTAGAALASEAGVPLFDKDRFLEPLYATSQPNSQLERRQLSRRADSAFQSAVEASRGALAVSWWKHPKSDRDSGTPTDWLLKLPGNLVEVHCKCPPRVAMTRFLNRKRHPGHLDELWPNQELAAFLEQASLLGPLAISPVIEVDCSGAVDYGILWTRIQAHCQ